MLLTTVQHALNFDVPPTPLKGKMAVRNLLINNLTAPGPSSEDLSGDDSSNKNKLPSHTVNEFTADSDLATLEAKIQLADLQL